MKWHRVMLPVWFAVLVTIIGGRLPLELDRFFLWPTSIVSQLLGFSFGGTRPSWLAAWLAIYTQFFFWALAWETVRVLWHQLRGWEARRAVRV